MAQWYHFVLHVKSTLDLMACFIQKSSHLAQVVPLSQFSLQIHNLQHHLFIYSFSHFLLSPNFSYVLSHSRPIIACVMVCRLMRPVHGSGVTLRHHL